MAVRPLPFVPLYNTCEKVQAFWNSLKPQQPIFDCYIDRWLSLSPLFDSISLQSRVSVLLWDVISNRFVYVGDKTKVLGNNAPYLLKDDGMDFTFSCIHPDYVQFILLTHSTIMDYCLRHPRFASKEIIGNFDFVYQKKDDGYIHILQQVMPVEVNQDKHPVLFLSYVYDISHLKRHQSANLVIKSPEEILIWDYDFDKKNLNPSKEPSQKEYDVFLLLAEGKHTKEIADKLCISPHTVDTHRRNLLSKTNCVDTTALVTYCRMVGLI